MSLASVFGEAWSERGSKPLPPSLRLLLDTHAALAMDLEAAVTPDEMVGAFFLESENPVSMKEAAFSAALAAIDAADGAAPAQVRAARAAGSGIDEILGLPDPLRDATFESLSKNQWKYVGNGIRSLMLDLGDRSHTELLRIEPGAAAPRHDHAGYEYTLVVSGAFHDETGRYGPGDLAIRKPGDVHRPIGEAGGVCYALAVAEGPVALTGAMGFLQRLFTRH
jgi:putative transcriptional regulator